MKKADKKKVKKSLSIKTILFVLAFAGVGLVLLLATKAATPNASSEAENSTVASPTTKVTGDSTASGGGYIKFVTTSPSTGTYYIIGSGDIAKAGSETEVSAVGNQIKNLNPAADAVFLFGDNAYDSGTYSEYMSYYDPVWGSFKNKTYPSPGNHEYDSSGAAGYYQYFNATSTSITGHNVDGRPDKGYYAWNIGAKWRFYSLNTEANEVEANNWFDADLAANKASRPCQVAYWHKPAYTSPSHHANDSDAQRYLATLYKYRGELALWGHNHVYERLYPINGTGGLDNTNGVIGMTVGTGGAPQGDGYAISSPISISAKHNSDTWGNILLTAKDDLTFKVDFLRAYGNSFSDSTSGSCKL